MADLSYKRTDSLPKEESTEFPIMYIFRHGQSVDNKNFIFSGWRDSPLTQDGKDQAMVLAEKLKDKDINMLISSPQKRALETMEIAISLNERAKNLEVHTDDRIKERSYGDLQGTSKKEYEEKDPESLKKIRRSFKTVPPNGESIEMVCGRVADFCGEIVPFMKENKLNVAISCHGNSIRGFRRYFEGLSDEKTATLETPLGQDYGSYGIK
jgi:2,3-bisphosphoglycerate-dependent phosphoglycerate mutase